MASTHNNFDHTSAVQHYDFDAIDLTMSSPEPEDRPKKSRQEQPKHDHDVKPPQVSVVKAEPVLSTRNEGHESGTQQGSLPINPEHMAMIINTSNEHAVREVLLELCQISPALSGAVARGLAPHSSYARGLMRQHRRRSPPSFSSAASESVISGDNYGNGYDRNLPHSQHWLKAGNMSRQAGSSSNVNKTRPMSTPGQRPWKAQAGHRDTQSSDSDLDLDLKVPGAFPGSARRSKSLYTTSKDLFSPSVSSPASNLAQRSKPFASTQLTPQVKPEIKRCKQCHENYQYENETCFYHPKERTVIDGEMVCSACESPVTDLGCQLGVHEREQG